MDLPLLVPLLITTCVAILGWVVAHRFTAARDLKNKRLELRTRYLLEAYRQLERAVGRRVTQETVSVVESAFADIHLLGSREHVQKTAEYVHELGDKDLGDLPLGPLLLDLRNSLRQELGLEPLESDVEHLRVNVHPPKEVTDTVSQGGAMERTTEEEQSLGR